MGQEKWFVKLKGIKICYTLVAYGPHAILCSNWRVGGWVGQNQSERCSILELCMEKWTIPNQGA